MDYDLGLLDGSGEERLVVASWLAKGYGTGTTPSAPPRAR